MTRLVLVLFFAASVASFGQSINSLSGKVVDKNSQPIAGAAIHVLNTNIGTISDRDGKFVIENLDNGKYIAEITAIGYAASQKSINGGAGGSEVIVFELEEGSMQLDAVVVTAQKQEEELQTIPSSISAISSKQIQEYRLWNSKDITAIVPNLYAANPGDNRNVTSVRGITSTSYDPAVATYIDGVNQFGLDTYIAQLFDVERIEVLRGPQGTLYGRNAMGGVINIVTKQPTNFTTGFGEINIGNFGQQRYGFGFKTPLVKNKLFLGISGVYDQTNGFYANQFNNSHFDKKNSITGNYYLKYIAGGRWAFTLNVKNNQNRNNGTFPLAGSVDDAFKNPFTVNQNAVTKMTDNVFNSSLTAMYAGDHLNFSSQTTYQSNYRYYENPIDGDFSPYDVYSIINNYGKNWNTVKVFTQEFKITSPAGSSSPLKWTAGTYLYYQNSPVKQATRFGKDAAPIAGDSLFSIINTSTGTNKGIAFFGQASYAIKKWEITAGLRYDYENKELKVLGEYQHDPDPNPMFPIRPDTSASVTYSAISPKFTAAYRATTNNVLFATYNRGFRTGGLTQFSADPSQPPLYAYKPEYSNNIEVGIKNIFFDNRLKVNLAAFYIDVTDVQVPTLVLPSAVTITKNAGHLISKGVELELATTPLKGLQVEYNLGINDATFKILKLSQNGQEVDLSGNHQIFTPRTTSMLAVQYQQGFGASQKLKAIVRGEWMYLGDQYFDLGNTIQQSSYSLLNTRFGVSYGTLDVMVWGRNLTDVKYISYAYDFGATHLGNPLTYGVTVRKSF